jgi:hypothetical protein
MLTGLGSSELGLIVLEAKLLSPDATAIVRLDVTVLEASGLCATAGKEAAPEIDRDSKGKRAKRDRFCIGVSNLMRDSPADGRSGASAQLSLFEPRT